MDINKMTVNITMGTYSTCPSTVTKRAPFYTYLYLGIGGKEFSLDTDSGTPDFSTSGSTEFIFGDGSNIVCSAHNDPRNQDSAYFSGTWDQHILTTSDIEKYPMYVRMQNKQMLDSTRDYVRFTHIQVDVEVVLLNGSYQESTIAQEDRDIELGEAFGHRVYLTKHLLGYVADPPL